MALFGKEASTLIKLKQKQYKNQEEKQELLELLAQERPATKDILWMLTSEDSRLREFGNGIVGKDKSHSLLDLLLAEMKDKGTSGKKHIPPLIARCMPPGVFDFIRKNISSQKEEERYLAVELVIQFVHTERYFDVYEEALKDPKEDIRYMATKKLIGSIHNHKIFLLLRSHLTDESDRIRHLIITHMAKISDPLVIEPFFERLPLEPEAIQKRILDALCKLANSPEANMEKYILPALADENEVTRNAAALLLVKMPNKKELIRNFLEYFRGIAYWLRDRVYKAFNTVASEIADVVLELLDEEDESIRIESMLLAASIRDPRIVPGIIGIIESDVDWWVKVTAIEALVNFKTPQIFQLLNKYQKNNDLQWCVISAYGKLCDSTTLPFLRECLRNKSRSIRLEALKSISCFDINVSRPVLEDLAKNSSDWYLRNEVANIAEEKNLDITLSEVNVEVEREKELAELKALGLEMVDQDLSKEEQEEQESAKTSSNEEMYSKVVSTKRSVTMPKTTPVRGVPKTISSKPTLTKSTPILSEAKEDKAGVLEKDLASLKEKLSVKRTSPEKSKPLTPAPVPEKKPQPANDEKKDGAKNYSQDQLLKAFRARFGDKDKTDEQ